MREIVLDTETTGLDPAEGHRIVELACVELVNHMPTGRFLHRYVNPERDMPEEAFAVHGLGDAGYARLLGTTGLTWSKARGMLLNRFCSEGGAVYQEWNPSPAFGTAINLIALQLDNNYLPVFRTRKNWR